uniref:Uncharacterized protein n=1 Tax=Magallana gigas TaxID=29159 RepID=K1QV83_MAGGI|eukprot:XP_011454892.1 PREDICTED: uncharacterized protein LOC105347478 [Crassostrea gigas]
MGLFQSCLASNNKVGVMKEEKGVYDKVRRTMVTEGVTEKKGGVAFGLTFVSEEAPKMPPRKLMELKREESEKSRETRGKAHFSKQMMVEKRREEARVQKQIEVAYKEMERLETRNAD